MEESKPVVVAATSQEPKEFVLKTPKNSKTFNVMRFNRSLNLDPAKFKQIKMERENNYKDFKVEDDNPKFGAGSEFGRDQKEEARRKKHGIITKNYNADEQPWILKVGGKVNKKFRGIREGGVAENSSFFVLTQAADGTFETYPVEEWYNFAPVACFKALSAEEAEEEFGRRDKVLNFFSIMVKKRLQNDQNDDDEDPEKKSGARKKKKEQKDFKISDMDDSWVNDLDDSGDSDVESEEEKSKKSQKDSPKKKKKKKDDKSDDEALEESDEGDFDDKEVDYITSSSGSEEEIEEEDEKANRELKGVEDEEAIRKLMADEEEEDEVREEEDEETKENEATPEVKEKSSEQKPKMKKEKQSDSSGESSSESSDSDFDDPKFTSAIFVAQNVQKAKKKSGSDNSTGSSRANTPTKLQGEKDSQKAQKRKVPDVSAGPSAKKVKVENQNSYSSSASTLDGINEEAVRRYLQRKPMTASELLHKFKSKKNKMNSEQLVNKIADVLKKMALQKTNVKGKMYLSLKAS